MIQMKKEQIHSDINSAEHIMVCLSASPSNVKIIKTAAKMASAFGGSFTALYVKSVNTDKMDEFDKKRLQRNIQLAEQLIAAGTPAETLLALLLQEEITAATKTCRHLTFQSRFARASGAVQQLLSCTSMLDEKNAWLQTLSWGHWWKQRNFPVQNSERLTSTTNLPPLKYRLRKHLTLLPRCSPRKSTVTL